MKTCVCCIASTENRYIREWVEHYLNLGFDCIFIYDNNPINGEKFEDVINDYITQQKVIILNVRGIRGWFLQYKVYEHFYQNYGQIFDWIAFFDCDEFLILNEDKTIHEYFNRDCFKHADVIQINWKIFDDNNLVYYENIPIMQRFTHAIDNDYKINEDYPENEKIKGIVRGKLNKKIEYRVNPHTPSTNGLVCVNNNGVINEDSKTHRHPCDYTLAQLNHYSMKTIEEYIDIKIKRGYADQPYDVAMTKMTFDTFFKLNKRTEEKENVIKKHFKNTDIFVNTIKDVEQNITQPLSLMFLGDTKPTQTYPNVEIFHDNTQNNISYLNNGICEFTGMYWVWKNYDIKDYIGFCQYRKRFSAVFTDEQIKSIIDEHGIIVGKPMELGCDVMTQYAFYHNGNDLYDIVHIINQIAPEYKEATTQTLKSRKLYINNCFIMDKDTFKNYCDFVWTVISKFIEKKHIKNYDDCVKRVQKNEKEYLHKLDKYKQNNTVEYQSRFLAYLVERLTNIFINKHFPQPYETTIISVEQKYEFDTINK